MSNTNIIQKVDIKFKVNNTFHFEPTLDLTGTFNEYLSNVKIECLKDI